MRFLKVWNPPVFYLLACLLAVRPTSGGRIGSVFSHNTEYWCTNTDLLFQLRFIFAPRWVFSSFIASLSLWLVNTKVRNCELVSINCTGYTYYVMLMAKCICNWLHHPLKLLPNTMFLLYTDPSQLEWLYAKTYMHVLGLWSVNTPAAKIVIKHVWW